MRASPSIPQVVEDFRNHLRSSSGHYLSLETFCRPYHVNVKSVRQWLYRHGQDVGSLFYGVLLEKYSSNPEFMLPPALGYEKYSSPGKPAKKDPACQAASLETIKGASVTFPDGVIVNIRQTSAFALNKFIDSYNKRTDQNNVQPE